jgi:diadenosine tetraphosphate (Ap4A) HIT family hydrolase
MDFMLHPRLTADTAFIADWPLCRVLLMNDNRFLWIVLVPRRPNVREVFDLDEWTREVLMSEIARAAERLKMWAASRGRCDKINIGLIGNQVPQLHAHVVARAAGDAAWPGTVWGTGRAVPYGKEELLRVITELHRAL